MELTKALADKYFSYNPNTGIIVWNECNRRSVKSGKEAGHIRKDGYRQIKFNEKQYLAHRIAWLLTYGKWPNGVIDHIDCDRSNNKIANLRDVTDTINKHNRIKPSAHNSTGYLGVAIKGDKFSAQYTRYGKRTHIGCFDTPEEAHKAFLQATGGQP